MKADRFCLDRNRRLDYLGCDIHKFSCYDIGNWRTMATVEAESNLKKLKLAPEYIAHREEFWKKYKERHLAELEVNAKQNKPITITLPDGSSKDGVAFVTTPYDVAKMISQGLANAAVIAKVNGILWDLERPLESDVSSFELKKFDDHEGQQVFWHSSAHILGEAMENFYGGCLCYGPPIESGFFYDMHIPDRFVSSNEFAELTGMAKAVISEKQPFERLVLSKAELLELFDYNLFKKRIINERIVEDRTTVYKCGTLIDLCRGPHVRHTGCVKAIKIIKNSSTYWQGDAEAESLQRVYGISFPDNKQLKDWEKFQEEAAKRDHRKLGRDQELFFFHELSPGCGFFQPHGAHIYNTLVDFMKSEYRKRGFKEVITPNMFNANLWKISGHWDHYAENMFSFESEKQKFALKPMNCPGHCLIFAHRPRSWRELPLRMADFGVLHRNELSGALSGLTRVRRFCQDDAHIFCAPEQVQSEIEGCLDFLFYIYDTFGFTCKLFLSTRPKDFLGEISEWDAAEKQLSSALDAHCKKLNTSWTLNPEDGAFYGPKIDITIQDALRRNHQCATIQLDFQLPRRFNLEYNPKEGDSARPVIIHRAILGSMERMMAVLTENYGGKWPFWLSPRQVIVVPVGRPFNDYAQQVHKQLWEAGFQSECDLDDGDTMQKKIRNAQIAQFNFILVVGQKEQSSETVNIRTRTNVVLGELSVEDFISKLQHCKSARLKDTDEVFGKEK